MSPVVLFNQWLTPLERIQVSKQQHHQWSSFFSYLWVIMASFVCVSDNIPCVAKRLNDIIGGFWMPLQIIIDTLVGHSTPDDARRKGINGS